MYEFTANLTKVYCFRASTSWLLLMAFGLLLLGAEATAQTVALDRLDHIHGLAVDPDRSSRLYLATHSGLFLAAPNGMATRVGASKDDLMSFAVHPENPDVIYASGHPPGGGNLGLLVSRDRGSTWQRLSAGVDGPVDYHAMDVSRADSQVIYGMYKGLQASGDGGKTWRQVGPMPKDTFDLAASASAPDALYAAARGGLFASRDGGRNWIRAYLESRPATLVHVTDQEVHAFVYGVGFLAGQEPGLGWEVRSAAFGDRYLLHMTVDPDDPNRFHAVADTGTVLTSKDGGRTWVSYTGHDRETPEVVAEAAKLYDKICESCHGAKGVGERPEEMYARDDYGVVAPPLDDTAHAWHHSDSNLVETIMNGSPRNPRMMPFKTIISEQDARNVVAYIKSLWNPRSLACQGARHMRCPH
jgi:mono/diheme cytochrome c family protein